MSVDETSTAVLLQPQTEPGLWTMPADLVTFRRHGWNAAGLAVRMVPGDAAATDAELFRTLARCLDLPVTFGETWEFLDETLGAVDELIGLDAEVGLVIVIEHPEAVLSSGRLEQLVAVLARAAHDWAAPVDDGDEWDRPAVPFHVVLAPDERRTPAWAARWLAAGATLHPLPTA
ncbi:MAG: hypothetical protein JWP75_3152 [Frondihabitans sp.]|nr:hypothetical protein [Frondihabitans sp.]